MKQNDTPKKVLPTFNQMKFPSGVALFLDVDGTLVEIADKPASVVISKTLKQLLSKLEKHVDGALALISGRTISEVDQLFQPLKLPVSGKHGFESRDTSGLIHISPYEVSNEMAHIRRNLQQFAIKNPGTLVENKEQTLALHYRLNPEIKNQATNLVNLLIANHYNLEVLEGKMVLEIKPKANHKGTAISKFMQEKPFVGKTPFFFGDDVSDEDGFKTINAINGISICINPLTESNAKFRLKTVDSVIHWLEHFCKNKKLES